jgi:hypothetical protein
VSVTDLNLTSERTGTAWLQRVVVPLLLVTSVVVAARLLRTSAASDLSSATLVEPTSVAMPRSTPTPRPPAALSQDDPRLGMNVLMR